MVEALADYDDDIAHKYLEGEEISADELRSALRAGAPWRTRSCRSCAAPPQEQGHPADARRGDRLPAVAAGRAAGRGRDPRSGDEVSRPTDPDEPFAALAFKIAADPFVGKLAFFRVYSGTLKTGSCVYNSTKGKERIGRLLQLHANHREEIESVSAGDIAAAVGLKNTTTGDTLCVEDKPIVLENITFPEPVIELAVEPKTKADQDKMSIALQRLARRTNLPGQHRRGERPDPHRRHGRAPPRGHRRPHAARVQGAGQRRPAAGRLSRGDPQEARARGRFVRQTGGLGRYGHAVVRWSRSSVARASSSSRGRGRLGAARVQRAIEQGIRDALTGGIVAGYPGHRPQGDPHRRVVPRGRLVRDVVQDRRQHGQGWRGQGRRSWSR